MRSSFATLSHQPFLGNGRNQGSVAFEYETAGKSAGPGSARAILRINQPFIGRKRPMKPQRMIKARRHDALVEHGAAMKDQGRVEQHHIGRVREYALVECGLVGQRTGRAYPDVETRFL